MKLLNALGCFVLIIFLLLTSCSKNASEPEDISPVAPLVGTWDMTESKVISKNDPGTFVDMMEFFEFSASFVVQPNGECTITFIFLGVPTTMTVNIANMEEFENQMTQGDPNVTVTIEENTITVIKDNQTWDFGNGDEPALERTVYTRRQ